ncbi:WD40 repeat protein TipD [Plasmopara halstedii]|uniref:WD40 repeat protein TipD n=1 Tax=Plasmopara halstedii TaxID=4781 RepID=A0A0P1B442_PLAHL|nr:WD40 repeat protein TipD [Plasmopara halstedii]CEG48180.1 WD40 repeat protein TipD [Plasmopara halstedii]|eukprot:XP_024584549.1 WD40 repeat protein TipD [Plasmopara halstedii]
MTCSSWFSSDALRLLETRNRREVDAFSDLITSHQQLLFRSALYASSSSLSASQRLPGHQDQDDATVQRYLASIQRLERELTDKNAQLASYAGQQLALVSESKTLLQEREQWEQQLLMMTKRLEEEIMLSHEKDVAINELNDTLLTIKDELARHRMLLEQSEAEGVKLRKRNAELETQEKSSLLHEWVQATSEEKSLGHLSPAMVAMATQEAAESLGRVVLNEDEEQGVRNQTTLVTHVTHSIRAHATEVNSVCFNTSGKILFSGSSDGTVRAWEAERSQLTPPRALGEYRGVGTAHPLLCVRASEDGGFVLGTGCDRKCFVWRVGTGRVSQTLTGHKGKVLAAEFSPVVPHQVITGSSDRSLRVWDIMRGVRLQTVSCVSSCNDIAAPSGTDAAFVQFASAHQDGAVRFWDTRVVRCVQELPCVHTEQITSVSLGGNNLLTNSRDHTLKVIDPRTYGVLRELKHKEYQCGFDWGKASISPDGRFALAGGASGCIFIWNVGSGKVETQLAPGPTSHYGAVACCVWRPDGQGAASCDKNGMVALWE